MSAFRNTLMTVSAIAMIIMLMLNAAAFVIFGNMNYYRNEFEKYNVTQNIDMDIDDIMYVMNELMDYLHDDRADLENIITEVNGNKMDFFSEREKTHMADCKVLFDKAFDIRNASTAIFVVIIIMMLKSNMFDIRQFLNVCGIISIIILIAVAVIGIAAIIDFNFMFVCFHKLFFNNDLWILDPNKDFIINILVEDFFRDIAFKIGLYIMSIPVVLGITGIFIRCWSKKRRYV